MKKSQVPPRIYGSERAVPLQDVEVPEQSVANPPSPPEQASESPASHQHSASPVDAQLAIGLGALQHEGGVPDAEAPTDGGTTATEDSDAPVRGTQSDTELVRS